ncbi:MAG: guanylate kinase [Planctomycetota bacterium]|jgi:guanylate kinase
MDAITTRPAGPRFVCLVGPSGAGKSTLLQRFLGLRPDYRRCLSVTTRAPRGAERDGVDYIFVDQPEFDRRVAAGAFLEHATVFGKASYGTTRSWVMDRLAAGQGVIKDLDIQGAAQIRERMPGAVLVFVTPSQRAEIERRLRGRGTDDEATIRRRLDESERELAQAALCGHLVVNDDLDTAALDLAAVVRAAELRIS